MKSLRMFFVIFVGVIVFRLFTLQVVNADFYGALAEGQHSFYKELVADRGTIYVEDWKTGDRYIAATNEPMAFVYAEPRKIEDPVYAATEISKILDYKIVDIPDPEDDEEDAEDSEADQGSQEETSEPETEDDVNSLSEAIAEAREGQLNAEGQVVEPVAEEVVEEEVDEEPADEESSDEEEEDNGERFLALVERFSKENDPYEPIERNIDEDTLNEILALELSGVHYVLEDVRSYPEQNLGGHLFGFVGLDSEGEKAGLYGLEGYFEDFLAGTNGFLDTETDASGRWIGVGSRHFEPASDGGDLVLTIDRTVQFVACDMLRKGVERFDADGGSLIILEPKTGRVMAMCNVPDFDPNTYNEVEDIEIYNNSSIFEAYEPGSVFKPLVMAGALDVGAVTPTTLFHDTGETPVDDYVIRNSDLKAHGTVTMTEVLEESLNTGMIFVMRQMGEDIIKKYIEDFGFGTITGIELDTESSGTIVSLDNISEVYFATASYGQGITVTPMQLAAAYGALANGGLLMRPYIIKEIHHPDGTVEENLPMSVRQVVSKKTATTISAMMVSVVENGHAGKAGVPGYYIAGKTGTAQVAATDRVGYQAGVTMATFAGFGPVDDPAFVAVVKVEHPRATPWASETAAPIFGEISDFLLQYLEVAPGRPLE